MIQRYEEFIGFLHHLCNNIVTGANTIHTVSTDYNAVMSIVIATQNHVQMYSISTDYNEVTSAVINDIESGTVWWCNFVHFSP